MGIIDKLAVSLGRKDEEPNIALAIEIAQRQAEEAISELIALLSHKSKDIQNDSIKVLYEVGERQPALISPYIDIFVGLLEHRNNRLQWGAMTALYTISILNPQCIYPALSSIIDAAEKGSVITKDHAMNILIQLYTQPVYTQKIFPLLIEQFKISLTNQLPMYAEKAAPVIRSNDKLLFIEVLIGRLDDMEKESKRKRVEKVINKLRKA